MKYSLLQPAITLFFLLLSCASMAQHKEDVIYLKNGNVMHGLILKDSLSYNIRIFNRSGDTWVFMRNDIDSITSERPYEFKAMKFNLKGFEYNFNFEIMMRSHNNSVGNSVIPGINMLFGYRFSQYFSAGPNIGLEFYDWLELPLSLSFRLKTSYRANSPLIFMKAGYTIPAEKRASDYSYSYKSLGGMNATIGVGIERILNENSSLLFTLSYHYQELNYSLLPLSQWYDRRERAETYSRLQMTVGYVFK